MRDFGALDRWAFENRVSDHPAVILKLNTLAGELNRAEAQRNLAELRRLFRDASKYRERNQPVEARQAVPLKAEMAQPVPLSDVDIPQMVGMGSERPFEDAYELTLAEPQKA